MKNKENMWKIIAIVDENNPPGIYSIRFKGITANPDGLYKVEDVMNLLDEKISEYDLMVDEYEMDEAS